MTPEQRVLFVGHDASRTGAPMVLLHLLRWLRDHETVQAELALLEGGPLVGEFEQVVPTRLVAGRPRRLDPRRGGGPSIVYLNSATSVRALDRLRTRPPLVVAHVHELEAGIAAMPDADVALLLGADRFVAASERVRRELVDGHGADPDRVQTHHEFIDVAAVERAAAGAVPPDRVRDGLGIPADAPVVGAVGVAEWRKGPDVFVALASVLGRRSPTTHFVWLGADDRAPLNAQLVGDAARAGLGGRFHVLGPRPDPVAVYQLFDVVALTSREDPFPLVCLENAVLGTPTVCFDNTGMVEFVGDGERGEVVPYFDVEAMADRVLGLLADPARRADLGRRAAAAVRTRHDVGVAAPRLWADVLRWARG